MSSRRSRRRRHAHRHHVQAVEQVLAEAAGGDLLGRSGWSRTARARRPAPASPPTRSKRLLLQHAHDLALGLRGMSATSSSSSVPPWARSKHADRGAAGGRVRLLDAEQFLSKRSGVQRGAVQHHEGPVGAARAGVDHPRHRFLARAGRAGDQHAAVGGATFSIALAQLLRAAATCRSAPPRPGAAVRSSAVLALQAGRPPARAPRSAAAGRT
jgi:hypothetical protein